MRICVCGFLALTMVWPAVEGGPSEVWSAKQLNAMARNLVPLVFPELVAFLSIPNFAPNAEDIERNLVWLEAAFLKRGFSLKRLPTEGHPLLLASRKVPGAQRTVLYYMHFDGQATDPARWDQEDPFRPVLKRAGDGGWEPLARQNLERGFDADWRVFARSASDDKGPIVMLLAALDILAQEGREPTHNLKVILDGEEEMGSPHLPRAVGLHKRELAADEMVILDGPRHITNQPTVLFGCRGIMDLSLTTYGPRVPQHSGHYGNYAPNPAQLLAQLLASMKDLRGRVTIPGFYDGVVLDVSTRRLLAAVPDREDVIRRRIGIAVADEVATSYQESLQYPSLNVRGMASGWVGAASRTIVPATARAEIDIRLVPESDPARLLALVKQHIRDAGFTIVASEPGEEQRLSQPRLVRLETILHSVAFRTPVDSDLGQRVIASVRAAFEVEPVVIRMTGGTVPIAPFIHALDVPAVLVPLVNPDNNQHSPNENLRLGNFKEGIQTCLSLLTRL